MPYLNLDLDYFDHPKTLILISILGHGSAELPIRLWSYCGKFTPKDGILGAHSYKEIEAILKWHGKPGKAVGALIRSGYLGRRGKTYFAHDWKNHQGHIFAIKKRNQKIARKRWSLIAKRPHNSATVRQSPSRPEKYQKSTSGIPDKYQTSTLFKGRNGSVEGRTG